MNMVNEDSDTEASILTDEKSRIAETSEEDPRDSNDVDSNE